MLKISFKKSCLPLILVVFVIVLNGCSALGNKKTNAKKTDFSIFKKLEKKEAPAKPGYLEFKKILIPGELEEIKENTSIVESSGIVSGTMLLNGRVDGRSLVIFFKTNMKQDGWRLVSNFKSKFATSLLFYMSNKWCLINISEGTYVTDVRVGVSPALYSVPGM